MFEKVREWPCPGLFFTGMHGTHSSAPNMVQVSAGVSPGKKHLDLLFDVK